MVAVKSSLVSIAGEIVMGKCYAPPGLPYNRDLVAAPQALRMDKKMKSRKPLCFCSCLIGILFFSQSLMAQNSSTQTPSRQAIALPDAEIWHFDQTASLGGHPTTALGHPRVIDSPYGKAVEFNGVEDGLFVGVHPLAETAAFTWEVIFRPDPQGAQAQRFFHLQEQDIQTGADTSNRMLFEIRIVDGQWCLDSFVATTGQKLTLLNCKILHPLGQWYRVTAVYDGKELRNYVGSELQGEGELKLVPQHAGRSSVGTRIDKRDYFKGAILEARMTRHALQPDEFLPMPPLSATQTAK